MKKPKFTEEQIEYFRKQGRKGGRKRAKLLSPERRSEIAKKAVDARESKRKAK